MARSLKTLLSIAASDCSGGAGVQADIRAGLSLGLHVLTAVTGVTAQNSKSFKAMETMSPFMLESQLASIIEDAMPDAIKIGMIGSTRNLEIIAEFLKSLPERIPVVVDPVLKSTVASGALPEDEIETLSLLKGYKEKLFPLATVITPNLIEFKSFDDMSTSCKAYVLKGGHSDDDIITDTLYMEGNEFTYTHARMDCRNLHGTGCTFSSLLAGFLALGEPIEVAFQKTCAKMEEIISKSCDYSLGNSIYGPLNVNNYLL